MKITTVLLDAGGIILDESDHERVRADIIVETLRETIPGYSKAAMGSGGASYCRIWSRRVTIRLVAGLPVMGQYLLLL